MRIVCFNVNITELICAEHEPHATEEITKMLGVQVGQWWLISGNWWTDKYWEITRGYLLYLALGLWIISWKTAALL